MLGLAVGAGLLSKYNVAIFDAALLVTALTVPRCRQALIRPQLLLAFATAGLVMAPPPRLGAQPQRSSPERHGQNPPP